MNDLALFAGSLLCHQLPDRTLAVGPWPLPVCARCEGLYVGFLVGLLLQFVPRKKARAPQRGNGAFIIAAALILALIADGLGARLQYWQSGNPVRYTLGFLGGCGISVFLLPLLRYIYVERDAPFRPFTGWPLFVPAAAVCAAGAVIHPIPSRFLLHAVSIAILTGIAAYYAAFNAAVAGMATGWRKGGPSLPRCLLLAGSFAGLFAAEVVLNRWLH